MKSARLLLCNFCPVYQLRKDGKLFNKFSIAMDAFFRILATKINKRVLHVFSPALCNFISIPE